jgi:hypothetical protein
MRSNVTVWRRAGVVAAPEVLPAGTGVRIAASGLRSWVRRYPGAVRGIVVAADVVYPAGDLSSGLGAPVEPQTITSAAKPSATQAEVQDGVTVDGRPERRAWPSASNQFARATRAAQRVNPLHLELTLGVGQVEHDKAAFG